VEPGMGPRGAKVCGECAKDGMLIVVRKVGPRIEQKVARPDGYDRVLRMLRTYVSAAKSSADREQPETGGEHEFFKGRAEGIEMAIQTIRREMGGEV
jgi:hypothetical protein